MSGSWATPRTTAQWDEHLKRLCGMFGCVPVKAKSPVVPAAEAIAHLRFFAYPDAAELQKLEKGVGSGQCVALIQTYVPEISQTASWQMGPRVQDMPAKDIPKGAVIATFWNGAYPKDRARGKHAAFYIGHDKAGIRVVDQWLGTSPKEAKVIRGGAGLIRFKGITIPKDQSGASPEMGNTGEYYHLVLDKR
ncbi:BPSL0067 family protein [Falsiroseomonas sp.]|uniref:BPSL0067 family protein n=1 Tax=Falsiroseomonas sp. TaxID=2870721 RepID=UPI0027327039|nr:BPSL0067 family protein [Falsiroseomonas sp.]MDP3416601.1 BPSL0067 family protein [Falsiroseomonas sp.]